ncbi:MAG: hypothetical protein LBJ20_08130 [Candidatus Methanoplasma sp.]|jgi:hypothetical protein|nr:hypothetical protein [Candidatus Methanoplasma sp.]
MKIDTMVLLSVALCAVVLAGELTAYGTDFHSYSADAEFGDGRISLSVTSSGSDTYSAVFTDSGTHAPVTKLYIYLDERYDEFLEEAREASGLRGTNQEYSANQVYKSLRARGFNDISICNDAELYAMLGGSGISEGLLVMSYALPESIYSGSPGDILFKWISSGGSLYWMSSPIGMFYRTGDRLSKAENAQELFFGAECVNAEDTDPALSVIDGGGLTDALYLKWNRTLYGLKLSCIEGQVSMGFSMNGYSSVSMVPFGSGMICVIGGHYDRYQCDDVSQIIASGISCYSKILGVRTGTVTRGTAEILFDTPSDDGNISVYVSIGGYYTVFGRSLRAQ